MISLARFDEMLQVTGDEHIGCQAIEPWKSSIRPQTPLTVPNQVYTQGEYKDGHWSPYQPAAGRLGIYPPQPGRHLLCTRLSKDVPSSLLMRGCSGFLYSSAFSSTSSVSPRMLLTTLTASPIFSPI